MQIGARLLGRKEEEMRLISANEDPGSWGQTIDLKDKTLTQNLTDNGLVVENMHRAEDNLKADLLQLIIKKAGGRIDNSNKSFTLRLSSNPEKIFSGTSWQVKVGSKNEDGTYNYQVSQAAPSQRSKRQTAKRKIEDMEATGKVKALLVAAAGGTPDGNQLPLSTEEFENLKLPASGRARVSYKQEDKQAKLLDLLNAAKSKMEIIQQGKDQEKILAGAQLAAQVQQQLSILHPFHDGNGRISRAYGYLILRRLGSKQGSAELPELPLFDQENDQSTPAKEWQEQFVVKVREIQKGKQKKEGSNEHKKEEYEFKMGMSTSQTGGKAPTGFSYETAIEYLKSIAGPGIEKGIKDVDKEQEEAVQDIKNLRTEDLWIVNEMIEYASKMPEWLPEGLRKELDTLFRKQEFEGFDTRENFKKAVELKKQLVAAILKNAKDIGMHQPATGKPKDVWPVREKNMDALLVNNEGNQSFADRLNLLMDDAVSTVNTRLEEKRELANNVCNRFDARTHGISAHLVAYLVFVRTGDERSAATVWNRLTTQIIPSARAFHTWEEEVEQRQQFWVASQPGAEMLWAEEMEYRTLLAERWTARNPNWRNELDAAQVTRVNDALGAKRRAIAQARIITEIKSTFTDGPQLFDGNCVFAALANSNAIATVNNLRLAIVGALRNGDINNTPLNELKQVRGETQDARAAQAAYELMRRNGVTLDNYKAFMSISGVWGGDPEIRAWSLLNQNITVYILEPSNDTFKAFKNGALAPARDFATVLAEMILGTGIAIRSTGSHYIRMNMKPAQGPAQPADGKQNKDGGSEKKKAKSDNKHQQASKRKRSQGTEPTSQKGPQKKQKDAAKNKHATKVKRKRDSKGEDSKPKNKPKTQRR